MHRPWNLRFGFLQPKRMSKTLLMRKADLQRLRIALGIPNIVFSTEKDKILGIEALCILLRGLAYPNSWLELRRIFGRSKGALNRIFYPLLFRLNSQIKHLLRSLNMSWLTEEDFQIFCSAISRESGVIPSCFAFIDITAHQIARPTRNQS